MGIRSVSIISLKAELLSIPRPPLPAAPCPAGAPPGAPRPRPGAAAPPPAAGGGGGWALGPVVLDPIVHDVVAASRVDPGRLVFTPAVQPVEPGILVLSAVVSRRRID